MELERIELSAKERERLKLLHEVKEGHLKQIEAAPALCVDCARHAMPVSALRWRLSISLQRGLGSAERPYGNG